MVRNYLKIALRNIQRQRFYAFINIAGLTIGLITGLLIVLYIIDEFSYDTFHKDASRIYRINLAGRMSGQEFNSLYTSAPLAAGIMQDIPGVEKSCRVAQRKDVLVKNGDDDFLEKTILLADSGYFDFFSFRLFEGNRNTVLSGPNSIVLTESAAAKIFGYKGRGDVSPVGKTLELGAEKQVCTITGITSDPPLNSHFHYSMILSMNSWDYSQSPVWVSNSLITYIKLQKGTGTEFIESKLAELVNKYIGPQVQAYMGISFDDFLKQGGAYGFYLQPLKEIHFASDPDLHLEPGGSINTIYLLTGIGIFIIIISCINFMNLSTARYSGRAKEVGIRKSLGGTTGGLRSQFLIESVLYTLVALVLAHIVLVLVLPGYNNLSGKLLDMVSLKNIYYMTAILGLVFVTGILAGSYPAFYLTSFNPVEVLRGTIRAGMKSKGIRRSLVVFQFTMSTGLIICTLLVYKQLQYLKNKDKGFDAVNVITIRNIGSLGVDRISFRDEVSKIPGVINASICDQVPPDAGKQSHIFKPVGEDDQKRGSNYCMVDEDMLATLNLTLVDGRFFSKDFPSDAKAVVLNEAAARSFGWEHPVGQKIQTFWTADGKDEREVIGVVKDYNYQSLEEEITSLLLFRGNEGNNLVVRLMAGDQKGRIDLIKACWESYPGSGYFDYSFISDDFNAKFRKQQQLGSIFIVFTVLSIIVASMGLFGLATFSAEQRSKEIGVRKAMGASSGIVVRLMSFEYLNLILLSFLAAIPLSYLVVSWWLKNFAYKTNIGFTAFIAGGLLTITIAILAVGYQSLKAALMNPVKSLKYE